MITQKELKEALIYEPEQGIFLRRKNYDVAGNWEPSGYVRIYVSDRKYLAHRLAWLYMYGCFPIGKLDHINMDKHDNRIANLRLATVSQNAMNKKIMSNNSTGYKGIICVNGKYHAQIKVGDKRMRSVPFKKPEDAHAKYIRMAEKYFGEFANHG